MTRSDDIQSGDRFGIESGFLRPRRAGTVRRARRLPVRRRRPTGVRPTRRATSWRGRTWRQRRQRLNARPGGRLAWNCIGRRRTRCMPPPRRRWSRSTSTGSTWKTTTTTMTRIWCRSTTRWWAISRRREVARACPTSRLTTPENNSGRLVVVSAGLSKCEARRPIAILNWEAPFLTKQIRITVP